MRTYLFIGDEGGEETVIIILLCTWLCGHCIIVIAIMTIIIIIIIRDHKLRYNTRIIICMQDRSALWSTVINRPGRGGFNTRVKFM